MDTITLGGGCFWCLDAVFRRVKGINSVMSGYAGGDMDNPSYWTVAMASTGHAEVVQLSFDPNVISLDVILDIFWTQHDPTTLNQQGADKGPEYRSIILFENETQKEIIEKSKEEAQKLFSEQIVTEIKPLEKFYPAEEYHQDFFAKNPAVAYCQVVIDPKLTELRQKYAPLLKK